MKITRGQLEVKMSYSDKPEQVLEKVVEPFDS